jgi:drug/metabolite transporter (DMT)-like permease
MFPRMSARTGVVLAFVGVSVIWGSTYLGIRVALEGFPPFLLGALRFLAVGAALYAFLRIRGDAAPTPTEWGSAAITGALYFVVGNGLVNLAERSVSSGLASVLVATMPLWATLFERFAGGRIARLEWVGLALGFVGVVVLNLGGELRASGMGAVWGLVAPMGWALGTVLSKRVSLPKGPMCTAAQMLCGGAALSLVSRLAGEHVVAVPSSRALVAVAYLAVFGSLVGFSCYVYLLGRTSTVVATSYAYVNPVIALVLGVLLAGEHIGAVSAVGAAIVVGAVLLLTRGKAAKPGDREPGQCEVESSGLASQASP